MNASLTMVKKSVILHDDSLQIWHAGIIDKIEEYDWVITTVLRYLRDEGFLGGSTDESFGIGQLEPHPIIAEDKIFVFDYMGRQVFREKCR